MLNRQGGGRYCVREVRNASLESITSSLFLEKPVEIDAYRLILGALAETALGEEESRELIATLATELYADREDHDDRT